MLLSKIATWTFMAAIAMTLATIAYFFKNATHFSDANALVEVAEVGMRAMITALLFMASATAKYLSK